ncbi:MAG TPA: nucleotide sugar dehydrogenase [Ktedonobacterales bacterium]|nr:nucleotide sugar dehydrogenase [Ktedonobacterales bacterium]
MYVVDDVLDDQLRRIEQRESVVGIIGLGYVGLPLAVAFAEAGLHVIGFDIDTGRVADLNAGICAIKDVDAEQLRALVAAGHFRATTDFSELATVDAVSICVPTPVLDDKAPDISFVLSAAEQVKTYLRPGQLVSLESTTYPGTTDELVVPLLEESGLVAGKDFYLVFSPERIDPGNPKYGLKNTPKIVGGVTPKCATFASALYGAVTEQVVVVSTTKAAELVKLLENTFRAVNIGLANEFAQIANVLGANIWEVVDAAATKPFGFMPFYPGPGVGGHCIPVDPHYLLWKMEKLGFPSPLIEVGMKVNEDMPYFVVEQVARALETQNKDLEGASVAVLGVAYKKDIPDVRESPALEVLALLRERGARITYIDAYVPSLRLGPETYTATEYSSEALGAADCVVIITDHSHINYADVARDARLVVDTRNATRDVEGADHVWRLVRPSHTAAHTLARVGQ